MQPIALAMSSTLTGDGVSSPVSIAVNAAHSLG